jgi:predicted dienelactone hydrolase
MGKFPSLSSFLEQAMLLLTLLLLSLPQTGQDQLYTDPGPFSMDSVTLDWNDKQRKREVPVRIYYPKEAKSPLPVIIWSHGLGGNRDGYVYLGKFWASHGYVVVHPQHKGSDSSVLREGGMQGLKTAGNARNAIDRPKDITFVIDQLTELNKSSGKWQGMFNLDAIGVGGHSFGAQTSLLIGGQQLGPAKGYSDSRVKALMPMSAPVPLPMLRDRAYSAVKLPTMHMTGTRDDSPIGETKAAERRIPFDHIAGCEQWFINFQDGDHMIFSGRMARANDEQKKQDLEFQKQIKQCSLAFWNAHLKHDAKAAEWLNMKMKDYLGKSAASVEMKK